MKSGVRKKKAPDAASEEINEGTGSAVSVVLALAGPQASVVGGPAYIMHDNAAIPHISMD